MDNLKFATPDVVIYTMDNCSYCDKAKALLNALQLKYVEKDFADAIDDGYYDFKTAPQIFIGLSYVGGFTDLRDAIVSNMRHESFARISD